MSKKFDVRYKEACKIVNSGIKAIQAVLTGKDLHAKERPPFCFDRYMDPCYKEDLSVIKEPLKNILQRIVITGHDAGIVEEALH